MLRKFLVLIVCIGVLGCGSGGPSIAGTWVGTFKGSDLTMTAKGDSSFTMNGISNMHGRWEASGTDIALFRDVKNGGDVGFGEGGDGAMHMELSKDGKQLSGKAGDGTPLVLTKK